MIEVNHIYELHCPECSQYLVSDAQAMWDDSLWEAGIKDARCWCGWEGQFNMTPILKNEKFASVAR